MHARVEPPHVQYNVSCSISGWSPAVDTMLTADVNRQVVFFKDFVVALLRAPCVTTPTCVATDTYKFFNGTLW